MYHTSLTKRLRELLRRGNGRARGSWWPQENNASECSRAVTHELAGSVAEWWGLCKLKLDSILAWESGGGTNSYHWLISYWNSVASRREWTVSLMMWSLVGWPPFRIGPTSKSSWATQTILSWREKKKIQSWVSWRGEGREGGMWEVGNGHGQNTLFRILKNVIKY